MSDFTKRLTEGIRAFANPDEAKSSADSTQLPSRQDAADLREFIRPIAGKRGAALGIKHARFVRDDGHERIEAEYIFDEAEINRAAINMDSVLAEPEPPKLIAGLVAQSETGDLLREVALIFEQATRRPGKEKGRTADRGIISEVSPKALPVYFRKSFQGLKERMVGGDVNPLTETAFIVDAYVLRVHGEPKGYLITAVHDVMPLDEDA